MIIAEIRLTLSRENMDFAADIMAALIIIYSI